MNLELLHEIDNIQEEFISSFERLEFIYKEISIEKYHKLVCELAEKFVHDYKETVADYSPELEDANV